METACIKTPLGIATIEGDENGIAVVLIADEGVVSELIPSVLLPIPMKVNTSFRSKVNSSFDDDFLG